VPYDFSEPSHQALVDARALAAFFGAELVLLNVISDYYYTNELSGAAISIRDLMPDVEERHLELLKRAVALGKGPQVPVTYQAVLGSPLETIITCAKERQCDLIVMGTHGRGGLGHILLGSTTERVLRLAACPVFTVKAADV
jgi:nucleotide-binding universal stress UspA family protein